MSKKPNFRLYFPLTFRFASLIWNIEVRLNHSQCFWSYSREVFSPLMAQKNKREAMYVCGQEISNISNRTMMAESSSLHSVNDLTMALSLEILFRSYSLYFLSLSFFMKFLYDCWFIFCRFFDCLSACTYVARLFSLSSFFCVVYHVKRINQEKHSSLIKTQTFLRRREYEYFFFSWWTMFTEIEEIARIFSTFVVETMKWVLKSGYVDFDSFLVASEKLSLFCWCSYSWE